MVDEFDLGYVITSVVPTEVRTVPGDLPTTVIDKQTGKVTTWPRVPSTVVAELYRRSQPAGPTAPAPSTHRACWSGRSTGAPPRTPPRT